MQINEWLETKDIEPISDKTLGAIEEFIGGTQLAFASQSLELTREHHTWLRSTMLTKREQFAGFALIGLSRMKGRSSDKINEAFLLADKMLEKIDE